MFSRSFALSLMLMGALVLAGCGGGSSNIDGAWCTIDDPAAHAATEAGAPVECPTPESAQTFPNELILPMPCGRSMVFRKVAFRSGSVLDDEAAFFGADVGVEEDPLAAAMTGPWRDSVGGSYQTTAADGGLESFYYIGKYEVTAPQFGLLRAGAFDSEGRCGRSETGGAQPGRVLPATDLSFAEAISFADFYSRWLIAEDRRRLEAGETPVTPWSGSAPGFVRLPTEAEWEFAARGGAAPPALQSQRTYEVFTEGQARTPDIAEIAFVADAQTQPAEGARTFYVGRRLPNRLGLYDMVGNAEELVFEIFRPLRGDGVSGRRGGAVARGGSADDGATIVGVGRRREVDMYTIDGPGRSEVLGFRVVLAAPFFVNSRGPDWTSLTGNPDLLEGIRAAQPNTIGQDAARSQALARVIELRNLSGDAARAAEVQSGLAEIEASLRRSVAEANEQARAVGERQLESAVIAAVNIRYLRILGDTFETELRNLTSGQIVGNAAEIREITEAIRANIDTTRTAERASFEFYSDSIVELARLPASELAAISSVVEDRFRRRELRRPMQQMSSTLAHIREVGANGGTAPADMRARWRPAFE